jgi:ribosome-associated protein
MHQTPEPALTVLPTSAGPFSGDGLISLIHGLLDEAKAEETVAIDLKGKSSLADQMVVTQGRSNRHVASIADRVVQGLKDAGAGKPRVEGMNTADWVLIDAGDVILHIFRPEVRAFYNLEKMWSADRPEERLVV